MPNYILGILGLLLFLLILCMMALVTGKRLRAAKFLLSHLDYTIPKGFSVTLKQADAVLMQSDTNALDLRAADVPPDVAFKVYLEDMLASLELPYGKLEAPEVAPPSTWNSLSQKQELPNLYVLYKQIDGTWVYVLLASDVEHYESGIACAHKLAESVSLRS